MVREAFQNALKAGIRPEEFWRLTPYETNEFCKAFAFAMRQDYKREIFAAWHGAMFARQKKLPNLSDALEKMDAGPVNPVKSVEELRNRVRLLAERFGGTIEG